MGLQSARPPNPQFAWKKASSINGKATICDVSLTHTAQPYAASLDNTCFRLKGTTKARENKCNVLISRSVDVSSATCGTHHRQLRPWSRTGARGCYGDNDDDNAERLPRRVQSNACRLRAMCVTEGQHKINRVPI